MALLARERRRFCSSSSRDQGSSRVARSSKAPNLSFGTPGIHEFSYPKHSKQANRSLKTIGHRSCAPNTRGKPGSGPYGGLRVLRVWANPRPPSVPADQSNQKNAFSPRRSSKNPTPSGSVRRLLCLFQGPFESLNLVMSSRPDSLIRDLPVRPCLN